ETPFALRTAARTGSPLQKTSAWGRAFSAISRLSNPVLLVSSVSGTSFTLMPVSFSNCSQIGRAKTSSTDVYTTTLSSPVLFLPDEQPLTASTVASSQLKRKRIMDASPHTEVRGQKSEVRSQKSEVRSQSRTAPGCHHMRPPGYSLGF